MTVEVKIYPQFWRLLRVVAVTAAVAAAFALFVRLTASDRSVPTPEGAAAAASPHPFRAADSFDPELLLPVVPLCVSPDAAEFEWSAAFAAWNAGLTEVAVRHGRADVVTAEFAFELDRIEKWHEGIGQALHYAEETGKRPALALIIGDAKWPAPLSSNVKSVLAQIDRVAQQRAIKLVLLRSHCVGEAGANN